MKRVLLTLLLVNLWLGAAAQCPPSSPLSTPYTENFDSEIAGYQATFGNCYVGTHSTAPRWEYESSGTANSTGTGPLNDASGTGIYAYLETSGGALGDTAGLITPPIDLVGLANPELRFLYHMFGATIGQLDIYINDGTGWTLESSIVGQQQTAEGDCWLPSAVSLSSYFGDTVRIKFVGERGSSFTGDISIDEIAVDEALNCPVPVNFRWLSSTPNAAILTFDAVAAATSGYRVYVGAPGFSPSTVTPQTFTNDTVTLTGLNAATTYEAYVESDCGSNGLSGTLCSITFETSCVPFNTYYARDFELDTDGDEPQCWVQYNSYDPNAYARTETVTNAYSGTNVLEIFSSSGFAAGDTLISVSPEFSDMTSNSRQVKFYTSSQVASNTLIVGTSNSQLPGSAFNPIDTITLTTSWQLVIIPLNASSGYNGSDKYVVFRHGLENTFSDVYIDDFVYEAIPACPQLTNISLDAVGITTATFSYNSNSNPVQYEFGPVGYQQGTGTVGTLPSNTGTISGLSSANCYDVYLRTDCTSGGNGTSIWSGPFTVCTLCLTQSLPYSENFDIGLGCFIAQDGGTTNDTWVHATSSSTTTNPAGLNSSPGWVEADSDNAGSGSVTMDENLLSPYIDASNITGTLYLEFDQFYQNLGSNAIVEVWDGNNWIGLLNQTASIGAFGAPDHQKIDITAYANDSLQVRFVYQDNGAWAWWWLIDNVLIQEELCARSTNFMTTFATSDSLGLSWTAGSGTNFSIEYGPAGFTPGTGTIVGTTNSSITITGLSAQTAYDFYLVDSCFGGTASLPVFHSASTACALTAPAVLPLIEGFENYSTGPVFTTPDQLCNPSYSWSMNPVGNGRFDLQAGAAFYRNGLQAMTVGQSSFTNNPVINDLTMTVDLSNYTTSPGITLSLYYMRHTATSRPGNKIYARGSVTDTWVQIGVMNSTNVGSYDSIMGVDIVGPLAGAGQTVGATTQIRFDQEGQNGIFSTTCCDGYTIDDLVLEAVSCPKPGNLGVSSLFDTTATLNWAGTASNYQYWFGPAGFYQGTSTTAGTQVMSSSSGVLIDTLSQFTCYEFLVRSVCSAGDSSDWAGPFQFCTPCSPINAPYFEDWDAYTSATKDVGCFGIVEDASFNGSTFDGVTIQDLTFYAPISTPNYVEIDNGSVTSSPLILVSPPTTDLNGGDKRIEFYARATFNATPPHSLIVGTMSNGNDASTFHAIDTIYPDGAAFTQYNVEFTAANGYNGTDMFFGLMHGQGSTFSPLLIDDLIYETIPTCVRPSDLQLDSADLNMMHVSWTSNGVGSSWAIEYGPVGFTPGTGTTVIANSNPFTINSLQAATAYDVYIREICAPGDTSRIVGPEKMSTTVCAAANQCWFPYDLLDSFGDGWNNGLVEIRQNGVTVATLGNNFTGGTLYSDSVLLCDNFPTSIVVSNAGGFPTEMGIMFFTPWGDTAVNYAPSGSTNLNTIMGTFTALCTPPTCAAPNNLVQTSGGLTDISMSWVSNGPGTSFEVEYGSVGHTAGTGSIQSSATNSATITSLMSSSSYDIYVREICGPNDTSAWYGPVKMNTSICAVSQQCIFNFDLTDSFGDGWNGAEITVYQNGIEIGKLGSNFTGGNLYQDSLSLCDSLPTQIVLTTGGGWPSEVGFFVYNPLGDTAAFYYASGLTAQGDTMANFIAYCTGSPSTPCTAPDSIWATTNVACDAIEVDWNSNSGGSLIEYGPAGFTPGTGTLTGVVTAPYLISSLSPGTSYDVYVADTCSSDTSGFTMNNFSTASGPLPVASFTIDSAVVGNSYEIYVDASASTDADTYEWNFGNGVTSSNAADTMVYLGNGGYTVTLIVSNACGSDTLTYNINVNIGIEENPLANSLNVYPNPANSTVNINFTAVSSADAVIRLVDAQGREVMNVQERAAGGEFKRELDVSQLASGIYMIEIQSGDLKAHRRLSVK